MKNKRLYLIDATGFCYRAFYGLQNLSTSSGQPTNAIYGFVKILDKMLKVEKPEYLAACFDVSRDTFRQKKFAEYKIQRPPMPDELGSQIPWIKKIISAYGIAILEKEGFEADDVIATLAKKAGDQGISTTIVSSDKDMLQLVNKNVEVFSPYKDEGTLYDEDKVIQRYGIKPSAIPDIIALMGDNADNIPGVSGIGEKTAVKLIKEFGSVENLIKNLDTLKQGKLKESIKAEIKILRLSKELAVLGSRPEIKIGIAETRVEEPDLDELFKLFKQFEFKSLLRSLPVQEKRCDIKVDTLKDKDFADLAIKEKEIFLYLADNQEMFFSLGDKIFKLSSPGAQTKKVLSDSSIKKSGHDLKTTRIKLKDCGVDLGGMYFDTMIAAYLLNPSGGGFDLEDISWEYLQARFAAPVEAATSITAIVRLKQKLQKELHNKSLDKLFYDIEMPLVEVLAQMEINGIKIDRKVLKGLSEDLGKKLKKLTKEIYSTSGTDFNINSPKQLREILFEKLKLPVVKKTKTGPSTNEEVLRKLAKKHKLPAMLLEYRQLMKLKSTYIDALPELADKLTSRIHTSFKQTGTETGRLSSANPNLQNLPIRTDLGSQIRRAVIVSAAGWDLVSCDYSQVELRILAHLCGDQRLIEAFRDGKDIHKITASLIYDIKETDVDDQMREVAKRINFGIVYGLSAYGLSRDLNISFEDAQQFIDAYFLRYPKVKEYIEEQITRAREEGFVTTILGRRRYLPEINSSNMAIRALSERQAVNTPIQGSASDLIKLAMVNIYHQIQEKKLKTAMLLQVHDELVFEVPQDELKESIELIRERMESALKLKVPITVTVKKGKNWLEMESVK